MPVTGDPELKLLKREKIDPNALPKFDAHSLTQAKTPALTVEPNLPVFDATALTHPLTSLANEPTPDPVTPSLPSFNPDALLRSHALKPRTSEHEEPPAVTLPVFDPSMIHGRNTVESAPSLPTFDPELLRRKPESTSEGLPQFDPEQIKNSQRKLPD